MSEDISKMVDRLAQRFTGAEKLQKPGSRSAGPGSQWTTAEVAEAVRKRRCELGLPVASVEHLLRERGVPPHFWTLATSPQRTFAVQLVEKLLAGEGRVLVLAGAPGRGKSAGAAVALARFPGLWVNAPDLARPPAKGEPSPDLDTRMRAAALLVLDEVGLEHSPSGYAAGRICAAIAARDAYKRPTIITTNLSAEQFSQRYGDRIVSRLNGDAIGWQTCAGPDLRVNPLPPRLQAVQGGG